jgi:GntR family transcriptional regulator, transcriptional repressor for pyruvate dehydrogenase complex
MTSIWAAMPPALTPTTPRIIAKLIRGLIHRGELGPGDRLPPERALADQLGVARVSLRDALAQLQQEGYLVARRGAHGGTFVTGLAEPRRRWLRRMRENPADLEGIIDYQIAIEAHAARLAARRRDQADLPAIEEAVGWRPGADDGPSFRAADSAFHHAIAAAARSPRLETAIDEARGLLFLPSDVLASPPGTARSLGDHRCIAAAVRDGDGDRAAAAMRAHIESTRDSFRHALTTPAVTRAIPGGRNATRGAARATPASGRATLGAPNPTSGAPRATSGAPRATDVMQNGRGPRGDRGGTG